MVKKITVRRTKEGRVDFYGRKVTDPTYLEGSTNIYRGPVDLSRFKSSIMRKSYENLRSLLVRNGTDFSYMGECTNVHGNQQFICVSPSIIWEKYVGKDPAGGQNNIHHALGKMQTSLFLQLSDREIDVFLKCRKFSDLRYFLIVPLDEETLLYRVLMNGKGEIGEIILAGRKNGVMPSELIPEKIAQLRKLDNG